MSKVTPLDNGMTAVLSTQLHGLALDWAALRWIGCQPDESDLTQLTLPLSDVRGSVLEERLKPFWTSKDETKIALRVGHGQEPWYVSPTRDKLVWGELVIRYRVQVVPTLDGQWGAMTPGQYGLGESPGAAVCRCLLSTCTRRQFIVPKVLAEKDHVR